jgi:hypothetical protein
VALIAGGAVVLLALGGVAFAVTSHSSRPAAAPAPTQSAVPPVATSAAPAAATPSAAGTTPAAASSPSASAGTSVAGVWTGTYSCSQGLTGMKLTITGASGDAVKATLSFYPVASNPDVPSGSYALTGDYSASGGLVLNPDHWINQPADYEMVGFSGPPASGQSLRGTVKDPGCTTFSVTR